MLKACEKTLNECESIFFDGKILEANASSLISVQVYIGNVIPFGDSTSNAAGALREISASSQTGRNRIYYRKLLILNIFLLTSINNKPKLL